MVSLRSVEFAKHLNGIVSRLTLVVATLFLGACASYTEETRELRSLYRSGAYEEALGKLQSSSHLKEPRNRLLKQLELAMILDRKGEREKSRAALIEADKIADSLYTTSVSRTAASLVVSESSTDYEGEDFEKVAIHTMMALSFIGDNQLESAQVQARKINNKLNEINGRYESNKNKYAEDGFARYLAGAIHEARGDIDAAIVDYNKALELFEGPYRSFSGGAVPEDLVKSLYYLLEQRERTDRIQKLTKSYPRQIAEAKAAASDVAQSGSIIVIHEIGQIAVKTTSEFVIGLGGQVVRFSFPVIRKNSSSSFGPTGVALAEGKFVAATEVQDFDAIAHQSLEDRRGRYLAKQATRLLAKGQITEQANRNFGPLAGLAANVVTAVTETADTRSWTLLPEAIYVTRIWLKPGRHDLTVKTAGKVQRITAIDVKKGGVALIRGASF